MRENLLQNFRLFYRMTRLQKIPFYHITLSDSVTFCLPDIHDIDMHVLWNNIQSKANYFYLGCLQINLRSNIIYAYFPGCRMKNRTYLVSDVDPLCRNSYSLPIHCSKEDVYTALTYLYQIYKNTETKYR